MIQTKNRLSRFAKRSAGRVLMLAFLGALILSGCAAKPKKLILQDYSTQYAAGTILSAKTATPISYDALLDDLLTAQVVYVGENHTDPIHHQIQLTIIRSLAAAQSDVSVGMEMFDRSYQPLLDRWSQGDLEQNDFVKKTHWYANWRYPYELYAEILDYIKTKKMRLVALNLPFHIPPKIRIGGLDSLSAAESAYLPREIDTTIADHRTFVEGIFDLHHGRVKDNFEYFYQAQCAWEDIMAESVADQLKGGMMVVLAGNGHIIRKFGIPNRAFKRSGAAFRTVYLAPAGSTVTLDVGDYIWVTP